jgi:uncharacterized membrane protein YkvA (DUF1232 family)
VSSPYVNTTGTSTCEITVVLKRLKEAAAAFRREIAVYQRVRRHPRTPKTAKVLMGAAIAYAVSPIDLIPDFIPVLGHLDDLIIVPLLVVAALKLVPKDVLDECRAAPPNGYDPSP